MSHKPLLIFDGTCGFCKRWVIRFHSMTKGGFTFEPYQQAAERYPEVDPEEFARAAQCFEADGTRHSGADAMLFALSSGEGPGWPYRAYLSAPGIQPVADAVYRIIADHRTTASALDRFFWGKEATPEPPQISTAQSILGPLTGLSFFYYGCTFIPRWEALHGWYYWAVLACLTGGALLALAYGLKLRNIFRILARLLVVFAAAAPVNALATFGFTRLDLKWQLWATILLPVTFLILFFLTPIVQKIYRKLRR